MLSPTQIGVQLWEGSHAASGLPWWAAIPATTLAVRAALLPLSLRAYAASANVALLHRSLAMSKVVAEAVTTASREQQQRHEEWQQQQQGQVEAGLAAGGSSNMATSSSGGCERDSRGGIGGSQLGLNQLGLSQLDLVWRVFKVLRDQIGAPSFSWYLANAAVQVRHAGKGRRGI